jgi:hypothetical protein
MHDDLKKAIKRTGLLRPGTPWYFPVRFDSSPVLDLYRSPNELGPELETMICTAKHQENANRFIAALSGCAPTP